MVYKYDRVESKHHIAKFYMGRGGHLPALRPLHYFAIEADRELQQRLAVKDDAIFHMRLWCQKYFAAVQRLTSKYERFAKEITQLTAENVHLRTRIEMLPHELRSHLALHTKKPKQYLSPSAKKKRLRFLLKRQRSTRST